MKCSKDDLVTWEVREGVWTVSGCDIDHIRPELGWQTDESPTQMTRCSKKKV